MCPAGQIGSYVVTGSVGTLSLIKFTCTSIPVCSSPQIAHVETFTPPTAIINLAQTPLSGTPLIGYFISNITGFYQFIAISNPLQLLSIALPPNLSSTDSLTLIYWAAK